jgi:IPT/TIG domain
VGPLASLPGSALLPCEVPLAVITWSLSGIGFVDIWSVRRPPATDPALSAVQVLGTAGREVLGRAAYAQFQDHLAAVLDELGQLDRQLFRLEDRFRYLPAAGLIPLARTGRAGFSAAVFGDVVVRGPVTIDPNRVGALLDESFHHAPIDLERGEVVFLYHVMADGGSVDHIVFCTSRMDFLGDELVIDAVFPGGSLVIGQQIEIRGRNFGFSDGSARVRFDAQNANPLTGSSDTRLLVVVPQNLAVEPGGTLVTLEVTSNAGSDSVPVVVGTPGQEPVGLLNVAWVSADPTTIEIGNPCTVTYRVTSRVSPDVDVELVLDGTESVLDAATLTDEAGNEIVEPVHMDTDDVITVLVKIKAVPHVAEFTLSLGARVVDHEDIAGADTRSFATGKPTPLPDPAITIVTPPDVNIQAGSGTATLTGSTLTLSDGAIVDLEFTMSVTQAGTYQVRVEPSSLTPPWLSVLSQPTSGEFPNIPASEFVGDGIATREIRVTVARQSATVPEPSAFTLIVNRPRRTDDARVTYQLEGS